MFFSIIIPVYNRPQEAAELLESLAQQSFHDFEIVIVEDGSSLPCKAVLERYSEQLTIIYHSKPNTGRSHSRNVGMSLANGDYLLFFDSDCILPPNYLTIINNYLTLSYADCYGGPDKAHESFTRTQKAIGYAMTSFLTTGGIRGSKYAMEKFKPRTFNMGFSRKVYEQVGGFRDMFAEDIDLSIRIASAGFKTAYFAEAWVYHKRRTGFRKFYRQVRNFGSGRISLLLLHKGAVKLVHAMPAAMVIAGIIFAILSALHSPFWIVPPALYLTAILFDAAVRIRSIAIAPLAAWASCIQIFGYGIGFMAAFIKKIALRQGIETRSMLQKKYK
jgi:glycosyltransferase involved in cell wall biosynthesis